MALQYTWLRLKAWHSITGSDLGQGEAGPGSTVKADPRLGSTV